MNKKFILLVVLMSITSLYAKENAMKVTLLDQREADAIYIAMKDFKDTNKHKNFDNFGVMVQAKNKEITVFISEEKAVPPTRGSRGGEGVVFVYEISENGQKIENVKELLQR